MPVTALLALVLLAPPSLRIDCPEYVARPTWSALSAALRGWGLPDVAVEVRCGSTGGGSIETRLRGQRAIAELPPHEFGGPERIVEVVAFQVDALAMALGGGLRRPAAPVWVLRVALGARFIDTQLRQSTVAVEVDRLLGRFAFARLGIEAGLGGAFDAAGAEGLAMTTSGLALVGVRLGGAGGAVDGGLGARAGWAVLANAASDGGRRRDVVGAWGGPTVQIGGEVAVWGRGALRATVDGGWSAVGPVAAVEGETTARFDRWWAGLALAFAMRF